MLGTVAGSAWTLHQALPATEGYPALGCAAAVWGIRLWGTTATAGARLAAEQLL